MARVNKAQIEKRRKKIEVAKLAYEGQIKMSNMRGNDSTVMSKFDTVGGDGGGSMMMDDDRYLGTMDRMREDR